MTDTNDIRRGSDSDKHQSGRSFTFSVNKIITLIVIIILCLLSYALGIHAEKNHASATGSNTASNYATKQHGQSSSGFGGARPHDGSFGQVTAISSTSITVQNNRTGSTNTYSITNSTKITDNGESTTSAEIQTGDTVIIAVASNGATQASTIIVNPSFGGNGAQNDGSNVGTSPENAN